MAPMRRQRFVRPHQAWRRRAGFVGQGTSASLERPAPPATTTSIPVDAPPNHPGTHCIPPTPPQGCPPYPCPPTIDPRWWDFNRGCPIDQTPSMVCHDGVTMGCVTEQPCGVNVIGANTLGTDGIPPGEVVPLQVTAGDATKFHTKAMYFEALPYGDDVLVDISVLPPGRATMPVILVDALVGRISQLRRGGSPDVGLTQGGYANTKELVPTDWAPFTSTTEHNLALLFFNPHRDTTLHVFVDLWGDI